MNTHIGRCFVKNAGIAASLGAAFLLGGCDTGGGPPPPMVMNSDETFSTNYDPGSDVVPVVGDLGDDWVIDIDSGGAMKIDNPAKKKIETQVQSGDTDVVQLTGDLELPELPDTISLQSGNTVETFNAPQEVPKTAGKSKTVNYTRAKKTTAKKKSKVPSKKTTSTKPKHFQGWLGLKPPQTGHRPHTLVLDVRDYDDDWDPWDDFFCGHCEDDINSPFDYRNHLTLDVYGIIGGGYSRDNTLVDVPGGGIRYIDSGIDNPRGPGDILIPVRTGGGTDTIQRGPGSGFIGGGGIDTSYFWCTHMGATLGVEGIAGPNDAAAVLKATFDVAVPLQHHDRLVFGVGPGVVLGSHYADPVAVLDAKFVHPITPKTAWFVGVEGLFGGNTAIGEAQAGFQIKF